MGTSDTRDMGTGYEGEFAPVLCVSLWSMMPFVSLAPGGFNVEIPPLNAGITSGGIRRWLLL
jgi:hypothetical protein